MKPKNYAHRGARSLAPENTMASIVKAWQIGTDGVEVDVQATADGRLVLFHDTKLTRTTDIAERYPGRAHCPVSAFTLEELQGLDAGSWYIDTDPFNQISSGYVSFEEMERFQHSHIPTLEEVLLFVKNKPWRINLELKTDNMPQHLSLARETTTLIKQLGMKTDQVIISSFDHAELDHAHALNEEIEINALIGGGGKHTNDWGSFSYSVYNANAALITKKQVSTAREHGCTVNLYTVNNRESMIRFFDWGVSGLITDFPQILAGILRKKYR